MIPVKINNSKYRLQRWKELKKYSQAGVEYIEYIPYWEEVSKSKFDQETKK